MTTYIGGKYNNKEGDSDWAHPFPKVLGYKRGVTFWKMILWRLGCNYVNQKKAIDILLTIFKEHLSTKHEFVACHLETVQGM